MSIHVERSTRVTRISVTGVFDADAVARLRPILAASCAPGAAHDLVIDFSKAREVTATGLALLLETAREQERTVSLHGLSRRHHQILKLLSPRALGPAEAR